MILLSLILLQSGVHGLVSGPLCSFLCGDGLTCLSSEQVKLKIRFYFICDPRSAMSTTTVRHMAEEREGKMKPCVTAARRRSPRSPCLV